MGDATKEILEETFSSKSFGGHQKIFKHQSAELKCSMNFAVYIPPSNEQANTFPVLYYLSGLTCTEKNVIEKSGFQKYAALHGILVVAPDTSPRGCNVDGEDESWDLGTGAGFYVDASEPKWKEHYRMYSYVTKELPKIIEENFPVQKEAKSIMGHSMGGHGAIVCALKNPGLYRSVSAFAPIANPIECQWGQKAFGAYLGANKESWKEYDSTHLIGQYQGPDLKILVDQGNCDQFLKTQLLPENLISAAYPNKKIVLEYISRDGYDHSYYFISTFIEGHFKHHAKFLKGGPGTSVFND